MSRPSMVAEIIHCVHGIRSTTQFETKRREHVVRDRVGIEQLWTDPISQRETKTTPMLIYEFQTKGSVED